MDQGIIAGYSVTTGCWAKPTVPEHIYPPDGTTANLGSAWLDDPYVDWEDSIATCPLSTAIQYQYQSYHDEALTSLAYQSGLLANSTIPAPNTPDGAYYWRVRSFDGYTYSDWSEPWLLTVDRTTSVVTADNVVINELMWMGSTGVQGENDEWIELRNMTSSDIDLTGWTIDGAGTGSSAIALDGVIPADGYFLVSHYASGDSEIADDITVDQVVPGISLHNDGEHLVLRLPDTTLIDQTPVSGPWAAGENGATRKSMERNSVPGTGSSTDSWHSCTDSVCNDDTYWDTDEGDTYGTPGSVNHSDNDPTSVETESLVVEKKSIEEESSEEESNDATPKVTPPPSVTPTPPLEEDPVDPIPTPTPTPEATPTPTPLVTPPPDEEVLDTEEDVEQEEGGEESLEEEESIKEDEDIEEADEGDALL
ncbi:MAG: lamin tail domain-containing protein [Candidatus Andersenbacteria bacterium]